VTLSASCVIITASANGAIELSFSPPDMLTIFTHSLTAKRRRPIRIFALALWHIISVPECPLVRPLILIDICVPVISDFFNG